MKALESATDINGVLLVDKPRDWTSHDVCSYIRKRFKIGKVGHAGTLDPLATGLLVILLGKATKLSAQLMVSDKGYAGKMQLGIMTDSHDLCGAVIEEKPWRQISEQDLKEAAKKFTGPLMQVPPMVSALKHKGQPLYKLARAGKTVEREAREVLVKSFIIEAKIENIVSFSVEVSKGTYVRTLIHDLAISLGSCAALAELRRTRSGRFLVENALSMEKIKSMSLQELEKDILPMHSILTYATTHTA